jgi:hypothetical protein
MTLGVIGTDLPAVIKANAGYAVGPSELRALVEEVAARLPAGAVSAARHSLAAGRDMTITTSGGGIAAGVIHGNAALPGPTRPGPAQK